MEARVVNFRQGKHSINIKQMIVQVGETVEDAKKTIGKTIVWTSPAGKEIKGKITAIHGQNGSVRVHFTERGLPGQAIGMKVKII